MPLLHGTQENLIVSLIQSRSGSTEDKTENLISLQFASRKIAKLNSIPENAFQTKSLFLRDGRDGGEYTGGYETRFAFSGPAEKFS